MRTVIAASLLVCALTFSITMLAQDKGKAPTEAGSPQRRQPAPIEKGEVQQSNSSGAPGENSQEITFSPASCYGSGDVCPWYEYAEYELEGGGYYKSYFSEFCYGQYCSFDGSLDESKLPYICDGDPCPIAGGYLMQARCCAPTGVARETVMPRGHTAHKELKLKTKPKNKPPTAKNQAKVLNSNDPTLVRFYPPDNPQEPLHANLYIIKTKKQKIKFKNETKTAPSRVFGIGHITDAPEDESEIEATIFKEEVTYGTSPKRYLFEVGSIQYQVIGIEPD